jgi:hypothetical protein
MLQLRHLLMIIFTTPVITLHNNIIIMSIYYVINSYVMKFEISKRAKATTFINFNILVTYIGCWYAMIIILLLYLNILNS